MSSLLLDLKLTDISMGEKLKEYDESIAVFSMTEKKSPNFQSATIKYVKGTENSLTFLIPLMQVESSRLVIRLFSLKMSPIAVSKIETTSIAYSNGRKFKVPLLSPSDPASRVGFIAMSLNLSQPIAAAPPM